MLLWRGRRWPVLALYGCHVSGRPSCHRSAVPAEVVVEPAHWNGYAVQDEVVEGAGLAVTVEDEVGAVLQVDGAQVHQAVEDKRVVVALAGLPRMMAAHAD